MLKGRFVVTLLLSACYTTLITAVVHFAAAESTLLPKACELAVARFAAPSRAQLYTLDGAPAWLDARAGRPDDLWPTVTSLLPISACMSGLTRCVSPLLLLLKTGINMTNAECHTQILTLWRAPDLLPRIFCRHTDVSRFLIGTASTLAS